MKTYRIVEDDLDGDSKQDLTLARDEKKLITIYDWRSIVLSWFLSASALFVAGLGVVQFV